jgi:hypothetical protein
VSTLCFARWSSACCVALLASSLGCEDAEPEPKARADASSVAPNDAAEAHAESSDGAARPDADASADAAAQSSELSAQLIEFLREIEREGSARCPCRVEAKEFASTQACLEAVSFKQGWEECVMLVPVPSGNEEPLRCALEELRRRNACLAPAPCASETLTTCRAASINCPELDPEVLSRVLVWCRGKVMYFH